MHQLLQRASSNDGQGLGAGLVKCLCELPILVQGSHLVSSSKRLAGHNHVGHGSSSGLLFHICLQLGAAGVLIQLDNLQVGRDGVFFLQQVLDELRVRAVRLGEDNDGRQLEDGLVLLLGVELLALRRGQVGLFLALDRLFGLFLLALVRHSLVFVHLQHLLVDVVIGGFHRLLAGRSWIHGQIVSRSVDGEDEETHREEDRCENENSGSSG